MATPGQNNPPLHSYVNFAVYSFCYSYVTTLIQAQAIYTVSKKVTTLSSYNFVVHESILIVLAEMLLTK